MVEHTHREFTPGCFRCDLNRDEVQPSSKDEARERLAIAVGDLLHRAELPRTHECTRGCRLSFEGMALVLLNAILATTDALAALVDWPKLLEAGERAGKLRRDWVVVESDTEKESDGSPWRSIAQVGPWRLVEDES